MNNENMTNYSIKGNKMNTFITLHDNINNDFCHFVVEVNNTVQLYARLRVLMAQYAVIQGVNPENITSQITSPLLLAA